MRKNTDTIFIRVNIDDNYPKLSPDEIDCLSLSFQHTLIKESHSLALSINPDYLEYEIKFNLDLDEKEVNDVVANMVIENESQVRDGENIFKVISPP